MATQLLRPRPVQLLYPLLSPAVSGTVYTLARAPSAPPSTGLCQQPEHRRGSHPPPADTAAPREPAPGAACAAAGQCGPPLPTPVSVEETPSGTQPRLLQGREREQQVLWIYLCQSIPSTFINKIFETLSMTKARSKPTQRLPRAPRGRGHAHAGLPTPAPEKREAKFHSSPPAAATHNARPPNNALLSIPAAERFFTSSIKASYK